jgi:hypothetical protein
MWLLKEVRNLSRKFELGTVLDIEMVEDINKLGLSVVATDGKFIQIEKEDK